MRFVVGRDQEAAACVSRGIGSEVLPPYTAFGVVEHDPDGPLLGGIVLNDWNGSNVEITLFAPRCFRRHLVRDFYRYIFMDLKAHRLSARCKRSNAVMRKLMPRLGFNYEATIKGYYGPTRDQDALLFRMTCDEAKRWMR